MGLENTGQTIARLRKRAGLTQRGLAEYLGISDKAVSKWERGLSLPDISNLEKLAALLDTETDSLLAGAGAQDGADWRGVLLLEETPAGPSAGTIVYDKPLVYYPLSLFLLAGIRRIDVHCPAADRRFLEAELGDGSALGVSLRCREGGAALDGGRIMLVYGKRLLYGAGLTKSLQLAMSKREAAVLALQKENAPEGVAFDSARRVTRLGRGGRGYAPASVLFLPEGAAGLSAGTRGGLAPLRAELLRRGALCAQPLGRGVLEFPLDSWDGVADAAAFVRLVQRQTGQKVCDLVEIAKNRGLTGAKKPK